MQKGYLHQAMNSHLLWAKTAANASVARTAANVQLQKQDRRQSIAEVIFTPSWPRTQQLVCVGREQLVCLGENSCKCFTWASAIRASLLYSAVQTSTVLVYAVWRSAVSFFSTKEQKIDFSPR